MAELAPRGDVSGVVTDVSDPASVVAWPTGCSPLRGLPRALEQRRRDLGRGRQPLGAGAQRLAVVLRGQRLRTAQRRAAFVPRMIASDPPGVVVTTSSGDGGHRPGPLRLGLRLLQGGHQLLHRGPGPPVPGPGDQAVGVRLLPVGRPPRDRAVGGPAQPARGPRPRAPPPAGPGHHLRRVQGGPGRRRPADRDRRPRRAGRFAVQGVKEGRFVIGHNLDRAGRLLHPRADAIAQGDSPLRPRWTGLSRAPSPARPQPPGGARDRPLDPDRRYTVISADAHAGADVSTTGPTWPPLARRVRRLGRHLRQSLRRPARPHRLPQLGLGPATGRERRRRDHRRGALPQHGAAVLRGGEPGGPPPGRGRLRAALGRASRPTTAGWPTSAPRPPGRRAGVAQIFANRIDDALDRGALGRSSTSPRSAGSCSPPSRRDPGSPRCGTRPTSPCGRCARSSGWWSTSTAAAGSPTTATPRWPGPSCWSSCRGSPTARSGT